MGSDSLALQAGRGKGFHQFLVFSTATSCTREKPRWGTNYLPNAQRLSDIWRNSSKKKMLQANPTHPALDMMMPCSGEVWDTSGISLQVNNTSQEVFSTHFWFPFPVSLPTWELKVNSSGIRLVLRCGYLHPAVSAASGSLWRHIKKFQFAACAQTFHSWLQVPPVLSNNLR